ncbi:MAG: NAD(P)H-binding protein [Roseovarius sp.]|uniref:NmrA family NAD(P)-binding protein n=1 Tax=Roseovarius sp. TaxID=1486281 RepID=UPI0032EE56E2
MHVVFGAGGRTGGEVARALLARGEAVRVVVRREAQGEVWASRGAEVAVGDLESSASISAALEGADSAFFLNPPPVAGDPFQSTAKVAAALVVALRTATLSKAVALSSIGAQFESGTGVIATLNRFEQALDGSSAPSIAFLRSAYFIETWEEVIVPVRQDLLPTFIRPDQKIAMASTIDVGDAAAELLCSDWSGRRIIELSGLADWSAADIADAFSAQLGRTVTPQFVPASARAAALAEAGVPAEVADSLIGMYEGIANGLFVRDNRNIQWRGKTTIETAVSRMVDRHSESDRGREAPRPLEESHRTSAHDIASPG